MSLVSFATTETVGTAEVTLVEYPDGGVFVLHAIIIGLAGDLTISAYTRAMQAGDEHLHSTALSTGAATDTITLGPIVTKEAVTFTAVLDTGSADIPWWVECLGRVSSVENGEGEQLTTGGADVLVTVPYAGVYYLILDVSAMQAGDTVGVYLQTLRAASYLTEQLTTLSNAQTDQIQGFGPIDVPEGCRAQLLKTAGTNRTYPWAIVRLS